MTLKADVVLEGGGIKGIALVGAINYAEKLGYTWHSVAGTSAGALVGALLVAGYRGAELKSLMYSIDFRGFCDKGVLCRIPAVGPLLSLGLELGLYEGKALEAWISEALAAKGLHRFGDLRLRGEKNPKHKYRLRVIASDLSLGRMLVLPDDLRMYGLDPDQMSIAQAVRMSASLPYFYVPVVLRYGRMLQKKSYIVDGGLLSNYPVWLFDCPPNVVPRWPTFGMRLVDPQEGRPRTIRGPISLLTALFATMLEAHDARHMKEAHAVRTISINTQGVQTIDFGLSTADRNRLYAAGEEAAKHFFRRWDFNAYVAKYRTPPGTLALPGAKSGAAPRTTHIPS